MLSKRWLIVLLFAGISGYFVSETYWTWHVPEESVSGVQPVKAPQAPLIRPKPTKSIPPVSNFDVIARQNLFSADRKEKLPEVSPPAGPAPPTAPVKAPSIALYGVLKHDGLTTALVSNIETRRGDDSMLWVKTGDKIGSYSVAQIEPDRIFLTEGANKFEIKLDDRDHPGKRVSARDQNNQEPTVIRLGSKESGESSTTTIQVQSEPQSPTPPSSQPQTSPEPMLKVQRTPNASSPARPTPTPIPSPTIVQPRSVAPKSMN